MLEKVTENFNLDEKEAKVYVAALSLGKSKVSEIAKKALLNRITTYEILKRLARRGLATSVTYKRITYFKVIDPDQFLVKLERQAELAREALPQLLLFKNAGKGKPKVEYFDGIEGIRSIYEDTLNCKEKTIYNVANVENLVESVGNDFLDIYIKKRIKKEIRVKVLIPDNKTAHEYIENEKFQNPLREFKFFDEKKFPVPNEIMIYDNKVIMLSFTSKIGVVIEDHDIAKSLRSLWKLLWEKL